MSPLDQITDSPSGTFDRGQFGASGQFSCAAGLDGLGKHFPANEGMPTRGGEASASPFRPVGEIAAEVAEHLIATHKACPDEDEYALLSVEGVRSHRREG